MYENHYWKLDDGTIWSAASAAYVPDTDEACRAWLAGGNTPARAANENGVADAAGLKAALLFYGLPLGELATPEELQKQFTDAIQKRLDDFAMTRNYDNIMSVATYATSTNPRFAAEGQYAVEVRDATWARGYEILDDVLSGKRPMPTIEEVIAELPPLAWPEVAV